MEPPAGRGGLAGGVRGAGIPCWRAVPTRGGAKLTLLGRGRGALPAVVAISWWLRLLVVALPPLLGAWVMLGRGAFPLVVGWVGGNDFPR